MKKSYYLFFLFCFCCLFCFSQNPLVKKWDKRFGGTNEEELYYFQQTKDGGYILGGSSQSGISGDKTQANIGNWDYWIVKIDSLGAKQWDKNFGGTDNDQLYSLEQTSDGGYILGGASSSGVGGDKTQAVWGGMDYWIVKTDSLGNKQWDKDFGGTDYDYLFFLKQTIDGGYILGGWSYSGIGGNKTQGCWGGSDYWIIKIDSLGNKQWDKDFGGANNDVLNSLRQTSDGGYILGGYSYSGMTGDKTQANQGSDDYWIIKTDSLGNKLWDKDFGGTDYDELYSLQQTTDGGYILAGTSNSGLNGDKTQAQWGFGDYWIIKIDSLGIKQWDKDFGGTSWEDEFGNIFQTMDKGYLVVGTSYSFPSGDKTENNLGIEQTWIVKTDSLGNKQWDKTLFTTGHDEIGFGLQAADGCYVFANYDDGSVGGYRTQSSQGSYDYWIIKFCDSTQTILHSNFISSDTNICSESGNCINFSDFSVGNPTSWQWLFPGAIPDTSSQQNPGNICYGSAGTYPVTLIVTNSSGSDTLTVSPMITVGSAPSPPVITVVGTDTLISSHGVTYQWYRNGIVIPNATDSFYIASQGGTYSVQITDGNGCNALSGGTPVGVEELGVSGLEFSVYPNPASNQFRVRSSEFGVKNVQLEIYNVLGEKVASFSPLLWRGDGGEAVDVSSFPKGVYIVQLSDGDKMYRTKFIKN